MIAVLIGGITLFLLGGMYSFFIVEALWAFPLRNQGEIRMFQSSRSPRNDVSCDVPIDTAVPFTLLVANLGTERQRGKGLRAGSRNRVGHGAPSITRCCTASLQFHTTLRKPSVCHQVGPQGRLGCCVSFVVYFVGLSVSEQEERQDAGASEHHNRCLKALVLA